MDYNEVLEYRVTDRYVTRFWLKNKRRETVTIEAARIGRGIVAINNRQLCYSQLWEKMAFCRKNWTIDFE